METTKLTEEQRQKFADWMNSRAPLIGKCGLCGHREWTLIGDVLEVRPYQGGNMTIGGPVYPHVGLICNHCGNTHFINAMVAGILTTPKDKQAEGVKDAARS